MIKRTLATLSLLGLLAQPGLSQSAQGQEVRLVVNADLGQHTISRHIYGHFAEHLGRGIYDGFWVKKGNRYELREDIIQALRKIKIPNLRWPGGCFADYHHW